MSKPTRVVCQMLPAHVRAQLVMAATSNVRDAENPQLERDRRVYEATERVKQKYPQYFQQEETQ